MQLFDNDDQMTMITDDAIPSCPGSPVITLSILQLDQDPGNIEAACTRQTHIRSSSEVDLWPAPQDQDRKP